MIILPIRTEMVARHPPLANYTILAANCFVFLIVNLTGSDAIGAFKARYLVLNADWPAVHQFFTYQFLHEGWAHLAGNMLFLWVFGNSVNAKMGDFAYVLFYLAGGVFAGAAFALVSADRLLGASGAIAAVTTAYLVLFPRSRVTVLYVLFFIGTFEMPAIALIGLKIILWDNMIAPKLFGAGNVATSAHLGGYLFGLVAASILLLIRAIPRRGVDPVF